MLKKTMLVAILGCTSILCYGQEFIGLEGRFGKVLPIDNPIVEEGNSWRAGAEQKFEHRLSLPSKDYRLSIETNSKVPISVSIKGKTPMLVVNQYQKYSTNEVDFGVRTDRPNTDNEDVILIVRVGNNGKVLEGGRYQLTMRPYIGLLPYTGPLSAGEDESFDPNYIGLE